VGKVIRHQKNFIHSEPATILNQKGIKTPMHQEKTLLSSKFASNQVYSNQDITRVFLTSPQGGMRRSKRTNSLVLIAKISTNSGDNPYEDRWQNDGYFHYTGMGRIGDQSLDYMQNRTLAESGTNHVNIYLFESSHANEYRYCGEVRLAAAPYVIQETDATGKLRRVYKFPLAIKR